MCPCSDTSPTFDISAETARVSKRSSSSSSEQPSVVRLPRAAPLKHELSAFPGLGADILERPSSARLGVMLSRRLTLCLFGAIALFTASARGSEAGLDVQVPVVGDNYVCEHPPYKIHIVSRSPLVIYIVDFLTASERAHLKAVTCVPFPSPSGPLPREQVLTSLSTAGNTASRTRP